MKCIRSVQAHLSFYLLEFCLRHLSLWSRNRCATEKKGGERRGKRREWGKKVGESGREKKEREWATMNSSKVIARSPDWTTSFVWISLMSWSWGRQNSFHVLHLISVKGVGRRGAGIMLSHMIGVQGVDECTFECVYVQLSHDCYLKQRLCRQ